MIDSRAVISPQADIAPGVQIGPFSVIGPNVTVGAGTWIGPHVVINGPCRIGVENMNLAPNPALGPSLRCPPAHKQQASERAQGHQCEGHFGVG